MIAGATTPLFIGAGLCALASLIDTALRIPRILAVRAELERMDDD